MCDVTQQNEVDTLPRIARRQWGSENGSSICGVDILVNNAGLGREDANLMGGNP